MHGAPRVEHQRGGIAAQEPRFAVHAVERQSVPEALHHGVASTHGVRHRRDAHGRNRRFDRDEPPGHFVAGSTWLDEREEGCGQGGRVPDDRAHVVTRAEEGEHGRGTHAPRGAEDEHAFPGRNLRGEGVDGLSLVELSRASGEGNARERGEDTDRRGQDRAPVHVARARGLHTAGPSLVFGEVTDRGFRG